MSPFSFRPLVSANAALAILCALASPAAAQRTVVVITASPYWGYTCNPYAAYLHSVADVTRANGDFLVKTQEAAKLREEVRQLQIETRRKLLEQIEWERDFFYKRIERERERERASAVRYSRDFAQRTEIYAGTALNTLRDELVRRADLPAAGSAPVEGEWLKHIHVTSDGRTNLGVLKGATVFWPSIFFRPDFADDRETMDLVLTQVKAQIANGQSRADPNLLADLRRQVAACRGRIDREFPKANTRYSDPAWNNRHLIEAWRFLNNVSDAVFGLEQPDAAFYLNPLQGKTVAELIAYMKKNGLRFAPAMAGCERYYLSLHAALADDVKRLQSEYPSSKNP